MSFIIFIFFLSVLAIIYSQKDIKFEVLQLSLSKSLCKALYC